MTPTLNPVEALVSDISPHPANVRTDLGDITALAGDIKDRGLLHPLTVVTADAFTAANPDLAAEAEVRDWVVIAGHRRLAAAQKAKLRTIPVIVRDDLAGEPDTVATMLSENGHGAKLTPLEEARAFARLRAAKWSERKIGKAQGVSHGQVHKRLQLLDLPTEIQAELTPAGPLTVSDALKLLELPAAEIPAAWKASQESSWRTVTDVVAARLRDLKNQQRANEAHAALEKAGIEILPGFGSLRQAVGEQYYDHAYPPDTTVDQIGNPDDTVALVGRDGTVALYSRTIPIDVEDEDDAADSASGGSTSAPRSTAPARDPQIDADIEAGKKAAAARAEACEWLAACVVGDDVPHALFAEILANYILFAGDRNSWDSIPRAAEWRGSQLELPDEASWPDREAFEEAWIEGETAAVGGATAIRGAVALALADLEHSLPAVRDYHGRLGVWSPREIRHIRFLVEHADHELSEIEQRIIAHSEAQHAAAEATEGGQP